VIWRAVESGVSVEKADAADSMAHRLFVLQQSDVA